MDSDSLYLLDFVNHVTENISLFFISGQNLWSSLRQSMELYGKGFMRINLICGSILKCNFCFFFALSFSYKSN